MRVLCLLTAIGMMFAQMASAGLTNRYVVKTNTAAAEPYDTWVNAAGDIQTAINYAKAGETVLVAAATYDLGGITNWPAGSLITNRVAITKVITVKSANNDSTNTIIKGAWAAGGITNGPDSVRGVYMVAGSKLIGFTVTNGAAGSVAEDYDAGGIRVAAWDPTALISNCVIAGNASVGNTYSGGGAAFGTYRNCTFKGNYTRKKGGGAGWANLYNCTVVGNTAGLGGGGVDGGNQSQLIYNCLVISNTALNGNGGGTYMGRLYNCTVAYNRGANCGGVMYPDSISNCLIYGNQGIGLVPLGIPQVENCTVVGNNVGIDNYGNGGPRTNIILNCIIYSNQTANWMKYANTEYYFTNTCTTPTNSTYWSAGNITNNPVLVDFGSGYGTNHVAGNYRLTPASPCVNSGLYQAWMTNAVDLDGRTRIRYGMVDMGAYELINRGTIFTGH